MDTDEKAILVYGDLMLDRSWLVSTHPKSTAQRHQGIDPLPRLNPSFQDVRLGSAGFVASAISHFAEGNATTHLLGYYNPNDENVFHRLHLLDPDPPTDSSCGTPVIFHRLPLEFPNHEVVNTTVKLRLYEKKSGLPPRLIARYDQDCPLRLPDDFSPAIVLPDSVKALVIADCFKGTVSKGILASLLKKYPTAPLYIDSKDPSLTALFHEIIQPLSAERSHLTVFLNRHEASRLWNERANAPAPQVTLPSKAAFENFLKIGQNVFEGFHSTTPGSIRLVIKMDRDGALLFTRHGDSLNYYQAEDKSYDVDCISAGDVFLSAWVTKEVIHEEKEDGSLLKHANSHAVRWVELAEDNYWKGTGRNTYAGEKSDVPRPTFIAHVLKEESSIDGPNEVKKSLTTNRNSREYPELLRRKEKILQLCIADSKTYLGEFITVNKPLGEGIAAFLDEIRTYRDEPDRKRPLNCLIWAVPGSGKSFLVSQIAKKLDARHHEINLSRYPSTTDFLHDLVLLSSSRKIDGDILMLDEVDTMFSHGTYVFPLLLSLLWDGTVSHEGREWNVGKHFTAVLVASDLACGSADGFVEDLRRKYSEVKGRDLASRLNGPLFSLGETSCADRAYLAAEFLTKKYEISGIERGVLDALAYSGLTPRQLEYLVDAFPVPRNGVVSICDVEKMFVRDWSSFARRFGISARTEEGKRRRYRIQDAITREEDRETIVRIVKDSESS